jgi:hypothetical protein
MPADLVGRTELTLANQLRDPDSARFSGVYLVTDPTPTFKHMSRSPVPSAPATVCGWINSKNGCGGYTGRTRFYATYLLKNGVLDDTEIHYKIEDDPAAVDGAFKLAIELAFFEHDWREYCLDAAHPLGSAPDDSSPPSSPFVSQNSTTLPPPAAFGGQPATQPLTLGVTFLIMAPATIVQRPDLAGAWIVGVVDRSVAQKAGLQVGDVITSFDGKTIHTRADLLAAIQASPVGGALVVKVNRAAQTLDLHAQF